MSFINMKYVLVAGKTFSFCLFFGGSVKDFMTYMNRKKNHCSDCTCEQNMNLCIIIVTMLVSLHSQKLTILKHFQGPDFLSNFSN